MEHLRPEEIENESMRIIDSEAGEHGFNDDEWKIVRRIIHATADFEFLETIRFHKKALVSGINALRAGVPLYTDTQMLAAAISRHAREKMGSEILCFICLSRKGKENHESNARGAHS